MSQTRRPVKHPNYAGMDDNGSDDFEDSQNVSRIVSPKKAPKIEPQSEVQQVVMSLDGAVEISESKPFDAAPAPLPPKMQEAVTTAAVCAPKTASSIPSPSKPRGRGKTKKILDEDDPDEVIMSESEDDVEESDEEFGDEDSDDGKKKKGKKKSPVKKPAAKKGAAPAKASKAKTTKAPSKTAPKKAPAAAAKPKPAPKVAPKIVKQAEEDEPNYEDAEDAKVDVDVEDVECAPKAKTVKALATKPRSTSGVVSSLGGVNVPARPKVVRVARPVAVSGTGFSSPAPRIGMKRAGARTSEIEPVRTTGPPPRLLKLSRHAQPLHQS